jgi:hypothetical protein
MSYRETAAFEKDRAMVEAMRDAGEPVGVIEDFLLCLDRSDAQRDHLREIAKAPIADIASGDVIGMNPLTSQPQRSKPRLT